MCYLLSQGHLQQRHCISSKSLSTMESFVQFMIDLDHITTFSDANWGPQDASEPKPNQHIELVLFKSCSIAGHLIWFHGPLHWRSKRQSCTARSSAEAEIGSVDDCTKALQQICDILQDLDLFSCFASGPVPIHNDPNHKTTWSSPLNNRRH